MANKPEQKPPTIAEQLKRNAGLQAAQSVAEKAGIKIKVPKVLTHGEQALSKAMDEKGTPIANFVTVSPAASGLDIDTSQLTVDGTVVQRQNIVIADPLVATHAANVSSAGALQVDASATTQPVSLATAPTTPVTFTMPALVAGSALIGKVGIDQTTPGTTNAVSVTNASLAVTIATAPVLVAGSALIGKVGIDQTTQGTTNFITNNLTEIGGATIGAPVAIGSSSTGNTLAIQGVSGGTAVPVSGSLSVAFPMAGNSDAQAAAAAQAVALVGFNGTTWDRLQVDASKNLKVLVGNASLAVTIATAPVLVAGSALIGKVGIDQTTPGTTNAVSVTNASLAVTIAATLPVSIATAPVLVAGSALIGKVGLDQTTVGTTNAIALNTIGATTLGAPTAAGTPGSGNILTVQGNASGVAIPVSGSLSVAFPMAGNADAQAAAAAQAVALVAFNGTTWDRLQVDSNKNLKVINQNYTTVPTTGTITASAQTVGVSGSPPAVLFSVHGTYAGVNMTFEASDNSGTTYYPVSCIRNDNTAMELTSGVLTANTSRSWFVNVAGFTNFRVRATAYTSGTANIQISTVQTSTEPNPVVTIGSTTVTQPVSFTQPALVAGAALIGKVGIDQTTIGTTNAVFQLALGQSGQQVIPTPTADGAALTTILAKPAGAVGARMYVAPGGSLTYTIATSAPGSAPTLLCVYANTTGAQTMVIDEDLNTTAAAMIYVTAQTLGTGSAANSWRWI